MQIIVFIDYSTNLLIVNQIKLISSNTDKLNLRLVRAFIYLFQFQLDVKYRSDKQYIISDILSRFSAVSKTSTTDLEAQSNILDLNIFYIVSIKNSNMLDLSIYYSSIKNSETDLVYAYQDTLVSIFSKFKQKLIEEY